ncbi:YlxM family DNA-binding protein [Paratissierella segnis]|jgi:hypothetical protein|uniref:UPF0122 protein H8707_11350 n=1 Tax=Paratissierella segnis TaxID=2763679 RepID=A0A926ES86_9FIRM|nr:sigma factor-like helix-turn-helix DNA-binding protein [Paratissierella segnis]MBC8588813.1 DNA-binding protein [Paratissierella segnis]
MEKLVEIGNLYDFYGKLLSNRQHQAIEYYYIDDLSLSEIGEELNITRQGVFDTLRRAEQKLYHYEEILGLVKKFNVNQDKIREIGEISKEIRNLSDESNLNTIGEKADKIQKIISQILD